MSKYILSILDAMGNVVTGYAHTSKSKHQDIESHKTFLDDRDAMRSDWMAIGNDMKKSSRELVELHGN